MPNDKINLDIDLLVIQSFLNQDNITKNAEGSITSSLVNSVTNYVSSKINPNDKLGSVLEILAPGALTVALSAMGVPTIVIALFSAATLIFHINIGSVFRQIYDSIKPLLTNNQKITSSQVDDFVKRAVQSNYSPLSSEDADKIYSKLNKPASQLLVETRIVKLALIEYQLNKTAGVGVFAIAALAKKAIPILISVISFIFKTILASAGFMVAGDVFEKLVGKPKSKETTYPSTEGDKELVPISYSSTSHIANDEIFTSSNRVKRYINTKQGIADMLIDFAQDIYPGTESLENKIRNLPSFQEEVDEIAWHNHSSAGDNVVFIPSKFTSKKQLVDLFMKNIKLTNTSEKTNFLV